MLLPTDTYIPLEAVVHRAGEVVFINVSKLVVRKMGWEKPRRCGLERGFAFRRSRLVLRRAPAGAAPENCREPPDEPSA